ncbi:hypothetical protein AB0H30_05425 [Streptomyces pseudogriseolus]|uniref:hypothetical protein n=1 Tax=Streptomyces pseudogriseolus TaxID=36817 RepID=UPI00347DA9D5
MQQAIGMANVAMSRKNWSAARYALSRARVLVEALPANVAVAERERLSAARKRFAGRNTPAAKKAKQAKAKATATKRAGGKKPAPKKSTAKKAAAQPKPAPVRDLGDRFINRAALGYGPTNETR